MPRIELNPNKVYVMPKKIVVQNFDGKILIISPDSVNWILLHNLNQQRIYEALSNGLTVADVMQKFSQIKSDVLVVLRELEAKKFEDTAVNYPRDNGMYVYLTNNCNERCRHCYMYAGEKLSDELSTTELEELLISFSKCGGEVVTFTGGEATTRTDFFEILRSAKSSKLSVCLLTNGILLNREFIGKLKHYVDEIQISLDGYDRQSYFDVRQVDAFDKVIMAIDNSVRANIRTIVAITPLCETLVGHRKDYIEFARELRLKYDSEKFFVKFNKELLDGRSVQITDIDNDFYRDEIQHIIREISPFSKEEGFAIDHRNNTGFNNCGYGGLTVTANGDVYGCNLIGLCSSQGNIRRDKFTDIWNRMKRLRAFSDISNLYPCCECDLKLICGGGCRVRNFPKLVRLNWQKLEDEVDNIVIRKREVTCTKQDKEKIYDLMIKSNKLFYK